MPSKSKHGRGKRHRKKSKFRQAQPVASAQQQTSGNTAQTSTPVAAAPPVKPHVRKKASPSAVMPLHYEFISGDLQKIGILAGIVVVLLIIAYFIFT